MAKSKPLGDLNYKQWDRVEANIVKVIQQAGHLEDHEVATKALDLSCGKWVEKKDGDGNWQKVLKPPTGGYESELIAGVLSLVPSRRRYLESVQNV